jgi:hypothetical protein
VPRPKFDWVDCITLVVALATITAAILCVAALGSGMAAPG